MADLKPYPARLCANVTVHTAHTWRPSWVAAAVHGCPGVTYADVFRQGLENAQEAWAGWLAHLATPPEPGAFRVRATIGESPTQRATLRVSTSPWAKALEEGLRIGMGIDAGTIRPEWYARGGILPHFTVEAEGRVTQNVPLKTTRVDDFRVRAVNGLAADPASDTSAIPAPSEVTALREQVARLETIVASYQRTTDRDRRVIHEGGQAIETLRRAHRKLARKHARLHHAFHDTRRVLTAALAELDPPVTVPTTLETVGLARIAQHLADRAGILHARNEGLTLTIDADRRAHLEVTTSHVRLQQALQDRASAEGNARLSADQLLRAITTELAIPPHADPVLAARGIRRTLEQAAEREAQGVKYRQDLAQALACSPLTPFARLIAQARNTHASVQAYAMETRDLRGSLQLASQDQAETDTALDAIREAIGNPAGDLPAAVRAHVADLKRAADTWATSLEATRTNLHSQIHDAEEAFAVLKMNVAQALGVPNEDAEHVTDAARRIAGDLRRVRTATEADAEWAREAVWTDIREALGAPAGDSVVDAARQLTDRFKAQEQLVRRIADAAGMPGEYGWAHLIDSVRANREQLNELRDQHPDGEVIPADFRRRLANALALPVPSGSAPYSTDLLAAAGRLPGRVSQLTGRISWLEAIRRHTATALGVAQDIDLDHVDLPATALARLAEVGQPEPLFIPEAERALRIALKYPAGTASSTIHHEYVEGMVVKTSYSVTGTSDRAVLKRLLADLSVSGVRGTIQ